MRTLVKTGEFHLKDRGIVFTIMNPGDLPEPNDLTGTTVNIANASYRVHIRGVETFAIGRPYPNTMPFAILVGEDPKVTAKKKKKWAKEKTKKKPHYVHYIGVDQSVERGADYRLYGISIEETVETDETEIHDYIVNWMREGSHQLKDCQFKVHLDGGVPKDEQILLERLLERLRRDSNYHA